MKKLFYILLFSLPMVVFAQKYGLEPFPLDYVWKNVGNKGFTPDQADYVSLAFSPSGEPYVAYQDNLGSYSGSAAVRKFNGTGWPSVGLLGYTWAEYTSLAFSPIDNQPYLAYVDEIEFGWPGYATVKKFDGIYWTYVGNADFSSGYVRYTFLSFSSSGQPCVVFQDEGQYSKATVEKFDGTNWVIVGDAGFSTGEADFTSLVFSPTENQPYVAFQDFGHSRKATVMKFDGTNWIDVGNAGFSEGHATFESLAFSPSGEPYIAYRDSINTGKATVMKFDGTNWVNVGNAGFSAGPVNYTSIAFDQIGLPYIAFVDCGNNCSATVMNFDGNNWMVVGVSGFSEGAVNNTSLAFSPSGEPYVAYQDLANSNKATVMKYDSLFVGIKEIQPSKFSIIPNPATDKITVEITNVGKKCKLVIVNIVGEQLITRNITEIKTQIDLSNLPSGVYIVRLTNDKIEEVGKIIKQ